MTLPSWQTPPSLLTLVSFHLPLVMISYLLGPLSCSNTHDCVVDDADNDIDNDFDDDDNHITDYDVDIQATERTIVDSLPTRKQAIIAVATAKVFHGDNDDEDEDSHLKRKYVKFSPADSFCGFEGSWALCNRRGVLA